MSWWAVQVVLMMMQVLVVEVVVMRGGREWIPNSTSLPAQGQNMQKSPI